MKISRYKSFESTLNGVVLTTLVGQIHFESDDWAFEEPNMRGNEEFVKVVINNQFDNSAEPLSTVTIMRSGDKFNTYKLFFHQDDVIVSEEDMLSDTALIAVMPFVSEWYKDLVREAVATALSLSESESVSLSESLSLYESESVSLSESLSESESVFTSESLSLSESESSSLSESLSESESVRVSESISIQISEYESQLQSGISSEFSSMSESMESEYASMSLATSESIANLESELASKYDSMLDIYQRDLRDAEFEKEVSLSDMESSLNHDYYSHLSDELRLLENEKSESSPLSGNGSDGDSVEDSVEIVEGDDLNDILGDKGVSVEDTSELPYGDEATEDLGFEDELNPFDMVVSDTASVRVSVVPDSNTWVSSGSTAEGLVSVSESVAKSVSSLPSFSSENARTTSLYNSLSNSIHERIKSETQSTMSSMVHEEPKMEETFSVKESLSSDSLDTIINSSEGGFEDDVDSDFVASYRESDGASDVEKGSRGLFGWMKGKRSSKGKKSFRTGSLSLSPNERVYDVSQDQVVAPEQVEGGEPEVKTVVSIRREEPLDIVSSEGEVSKRKQFHVGDDSRVDFDS